MQLLEFLQSDQSRNLSIMGDEVKEIEVLSELGKGGQSKVFEVVVKGGNKRLAEHDTDIE
jgi:predicted Ser/Thr protein kinase